MKFSIVLLLATILALLSVSATAYAPREVCYRKITRCCFRFRQCGYFEKKIRVKTDCSYKVCKKVCHPVCYPHCKRVHITVPHQRCEYKPVRVCRKVRIERGGKWIWDESCKYERKHHCRTYYKKVWKKVCSRVCKDKCHYPCHIVKAYCVYYRIFRYLKFCPVLKCEHPTFEGPYKTPRVVVSPKGAFVRKTPVVRTDIKGHRKY